MKFELGQIVATPGALQAFDDTPELPFDFLRRHVSSDWGEVDERDRAENELSLLKGFRLMSVYTLSTGVKIWIITEADRSVTTILLPDEY